MSIYLDRIGIMSEYNIYTKFPIAITNSPLRTPMRLKMNEKSGKDDYQNYL
jgi:hypothetical protein